MAYISQQEKKELAPGIKKVLKQYGLKGTIAIDNYSSLVVNIKSGSLDLLGAAQKVNDILADRFNRPRTEIGTYLQANAYRDPQDYDRIDKTIGQFYSDLIKAMKGDKWYNRSDMMTDYSDIAYYLDVNIGRYNKPYLLTA
tara:strand:+ start:143 stop:565 length:423 start_codon:yes stop_codon:yes gene_type:complete